MKTSQSLSASVVLCLVLAVNGVIRDFIHDTTLPRNVLQDGLNGDVSEERMMYPSLNHESGLVSLKVGIVDSSDSSDSSNAEEVCESQSCEYLQDSRLSANSPTRGKHDVIDEEHLSQFIDSQCSLCIDAKVQKSQQPEPNTFWNLLRSIFISSTEVSPDDEPNAAIGKKRVRFSSKRDKTYIVPSRKAASELSDYSNIKIRENGRVEADAVKRDLFLKPYQDYVRSLKPNSHHFATETIFIHGAYRHIVTKYYAREVVLEHFGWELFRRPTTIFSAVTSGLSLFSKDSLSRIEQLRTMHPSKAFGRFWELNNQIRSHFAKLELSIIKKNLETTLKKTGVWTRALQNGLSQVNFTLDPTVDSIDLAVNQVYDTLLETSHYYLPSSKRLVATEVMQRTNNVSQQIAHDVEGRIRSAIASEMTSRGDMALKTALAETSHFVDLSSSKLKSSFSYDICDAILRRMKSMKKSIQEMARGQYEWTGLDVFASFDELFDKVVGTLPNEFKIIQSSTALQGTDVTQHLKDLVLRLGKTRSVLYDNVSQKAKQDFLVSQLERMNRLIDVIGYEAGVSIVVEAITLDMQKNWVYISEEVRWMDLFPRMEAVDKWPTPGYFETVLLRAYRTAHVTAFTSRFFAHVFMNPTFSGSQSLSW